MYIVQQQYLRTLGEIGEMTTHIQIFLSNNTRTWVISESKANYVLERTWCKLNDTEQRIQNVYIKVSKH